MLRKKLRGHITCHIEFSDIFYPWQYEDKTEEELADNSVLDFVAAIQTQTEYPYVSIEVIDEELYIEDIEA